MKPRRQQDPEPPPSTRVMPDGTMVQSFPCENRWAEMKGRVPKELQSTAPKPEPPLNPQQKHMGVPVPESLIFGLRARIKGEIVSREEHAAVVGKVAEAVRFQSLLDDLTSPGTAGKRHEIYRQAELAKLAAGKRDPAAEWRTLDQFRQEIELERVALARGHRECAAAVSEIAEKVAARIVAEAQEMLLEIIAETQRFAGLLGMIELPATLTKALRKIVDLPITVYGGNLQPSPKKLLAIIDGRES